MVSLPAPPSTCRSLRGDDDVVAAIAIDLRIDADDCRRIQDDRFVTARSIDDDFRLWSSQVNVLVFENVTVLTMFVLLTALPGRPTPFLGPSGRTRNFSCSGRLRPRSRLPWCRAHPRSAGGYRRESTTMANASRVALTLLMVRVRCPTAVRIGIRRRNRYRNDLRPAAAERAGYRIDDVVRPDPRDR